MNTGKIYCITSPSGKQYIGQVVDYIKRKDRYEKKGIEARWKQHCSTAYSNISSGCTYLNFAIRKYSKESFIIKEIHSCDISKLNYWEEYYINKYNTLVPNGYNLISGGKCNSRHSEVTCKKRSDSLKQLLQNEDKKKIWSNAKKGIPQKKKRKRLNDEDNCLPKYVRRIRGKYSGYAIDSHPKCKCKKFTSLKYSMEEKYKLTIEYLNSLK